MYRQHLLRKFLKNVVIFFFLFIILVSKRKKSTCGIIRVTQIWWTCCAVSVYFDTPVDSTINKFVIIAKKIIIILNEINIISVTRKKLLWPCGKIRRYCYKVSTMERIIKKKNPQITKTTVRHVLKPYWGPETEAK